MIITEVTPGLPGLAGGNLPDQASLNRLALLSQGKTLDDISKLDKVFIAMTKGIESLPGDDKERYQNFVILLLQNVFANLAILHDKDTLLALIQTHEVYKNCLKFELVNQEKLEELLLQAEVGLLSSLYFSIVNEWI